METTRQRSPYATAARRHIDARRAGPTLLAMLQISRRATPESPRGVDYALTWAAPIRPVFGHCTPRVRASLCCRRRDIDISLPPLTFCSRFGSTASIYGTPQMTRPGDADIAAGGKAG